MSIALAFGTVVTMAGWAGLTAELVEFFGIQMIALSLGLLIALVLLEIQRRMSELQDITEVAPGFASIGLSSWVSWR